MEATGQVRPEFALRWRQNFLKAAEGKQRRILDRLKRLLRAPCEGPSKPFFLDRVLKADLWRFDEACYQSFRVQFRRQVIATSISGLFILLACGATFGSLAINEILQLNGTTWSYMLSGGVGPQTFRQG